MNTVIVDMDGCLSKCNWREAWLPKNKLTPRYDKFHDLIPYDPPNQELIDLINRMYEGGAVIVILTGRTSDQRSRTEKWLNKNKVLYNRLIMRDLGDFRPSEDYKLGFVKAEFYRDDIMMVFDDLPRVINAFKDEGYPTFLVRTKV